MVNNLTCAGFLGCEMVQLTGRSRWPEAVSPSYVSHQRSTWRVLCVGCSRDWRGYHDQVSGEVLRGSHSPAATGAIITPCLCPFGLLLIWGRLWVDWCTGAREVPASSWVLVRLWLRVFRWSGQDSVPCDLFQWWGLVHHIELINIQYKAFFTSKPEIPRLRGQANWKPDDVIGHGQLLFLKGQLRILTTLSLLAVVHQRKAHLNEATCRHCLGLSYYFGPCCPKVHAVLQQSLQKVWCVHVELSNRKEELFLVNCYSVWYVYFLVSVYIVVYVGVYLWAAVMECAGFTICELLWKAKFAQPPLLWLGSTVCWNWPRLETKTCNPRWMHGMHRHPSRTRFQGKNTSLWRICWTFLLIVAMPCLRTSTSLDGPAAWHQIKQTPFRDTYININVNMYIEMGYSMFSVVWFQDWNWGSPYSEDLLSSKKLLVNFNFKTTKIPKTSPWAGHWAKVTKEALSIWVQCINAKWDRAQRQGRRQPTKAEGESLLEQRYLVVDYSEIQNTTMRNGDVSARLSGGWLQEWCLCFDPQAWDLGGLRVTWIKNSKVKFRKRDLQPRWMSRIREADPTALAELCNAVSVKDAKYTVRDNPSFLTAAKINYLVLLVLMGETWKTIKDGPMGPQAWKPSWTTTRRWLKQSQGSQCQECLIAWIKRRSKLSRQTWSFWWTSLRLT